MKCCNMMDLYWSCASDILFVSLAPRDLKTGVVILYIISMCDLNRTTRRATVFSETSGWSLFILIIYFIIFFQQRKEKQTTSYWWNRNHLGRWLWLKQPDSYVVIVSIQIHVSQEILLTVWVIRVLSFSDI